MYCILYKAICCVYVHVHVCVFIVVCLFTNRPAGWSGRSLGVHWCCAWCRDIPGTCKYTLMLIGFTCLVQLTVHLPDVLHMMYCTCLLHTCTCTMCMYVLDIRCGRMAIDMKMQHGCLVCAPFDSVVGAPILFTNHTPCGPPQLRSLVPGVRRLSIPYPYFRSDRFDLKCGSDTACVVCVCHCQMCVNVCMCSSNREKRDFVSCGAAAGLAGTYVG